MTKESKVALGIAAAALAGVAIGVLVAPSSGEKTRGKIKKGANRITNRLIDVLEAGSAATAGNLGAVSDKVKSAYDHVKKQADNLV